MNDKGGMINKWWILLDNQITVHMLSNAEMLKNVGEDFNPITVFLSGGVTICKTKGTLTNLGDVFLHEKGLTNILLFAKVRERYRIVYENVNDIFTVHTESKPIHF